MRMKLFFLWLITTGCAGTLTAQTDLTGTWEGSMGNDQFLQINILQNGNRICGYTYDYMLSDRRSYCKAYFEAMYNKSSREWIFTGTSFIQNPFVSGGNHVLMRLRLAYFEFEGKQILRGSSSFKSVLSNLLMGGISQRVYLEKVSDRPTTVYPGMKACLPDPPKDSVLRRDSAVKQKLSVARDSVVKKADTVVTPIKENPLRKDSLLLTRKMAERKNENITTLRVNTRKIEIKVFDNGIVDDDTVSVFYNKQLLLSHQRLTNRPIVINLELDEKANTHEILLFAENLGRIPPNTAMVVIRAGELRHELFARSDMQQNAAVLLEYKP